MTALPRRNGISPDLKMTRTALQRMYARAMEFQQHYQKVPGYGRGRRFSIRGRKYSFRPSVHLRQAMSYQRHGSNTCGRPSFGRVNERAGGCLPRKNRNTAETETVQQSQPETGAAETTADIQENNENVKPEENPGDNELAKWKAMSRKNEKQAEANLKQVQQVQPSLPRCVPTTRI